MHFLKKKATLDKVSYGSGQKCSKEFKNYSFTSVETIVVKLQYRSRALAHIAQKVDIVRNKLIFSGGVHECVLNH